MKGLNRGDHGERGDFLDFPAIQTALTCLFSAPSAFSLENRLALSQPAVFFTAENAESAESPCVNILVPPEDSLRPAVFICPGAREAHPQLCGEKGLLAAKGQTSREGQGRGELHAGQRFESGIGLYSCQRQMVRPGAVPVRAGGYRGAARSRSAELEQVQLCPQQPLGRIDPSGCVDCSLPRDPDDDEGASQLELGGTCARP